MDDLMQEGRYNKTGQSIGRCGRLFLLVALGVVMRWVYKVKRWENVPHRFAQMGLNRLVSDRFGLIFRESFVVLSCLWPEIDPPGTNSTITWFAGRNTGTSYVV